MIGNVWEWTASPFYPFPGYVIDFPYKEYSAPWFGYRKVLKGGSWGTPRRFAYNTLRNFFQPYRNDIFAGFRTCAMEQV
jgi:iron(II)-dependent oxidoreductase